MNRCLPSSSYLVRFEEFPGELQKHAERSPRRWAGPDTRPQGESASLRTMMIVTAGIHSGRESRPDATGRSLAREAWAPVSPADSLPSTRETGERPPAGRKFQANRAGSTRPQLAEPRTLSRRRSLGRGAMAVGNSEDWPIGRLEERRPTLEPDEDVLARANPHFGRGSVSHIGATRALSCNMLKYENLLWRTDQKRDLTNSDSYFIIKT